MSEEIKYDRRRFLAIAAMSVATAESVLICSADAQSSKTKPVALPTIKPGTNKSFSSLKQIDAGLLNVGYADAGPAAGPVVILLHGWPYDIHSYVDVAPWLASAGYRVIVPYLRGYGPTRFLSSETFRNGQPSAIAVDTIAFMDALRIQRATLAGFVLLGCASAEPIKIDSAVATLMAAMAKKRRRSYLTSSDIDCSPVGFKAVENKRFPCSGDVLIGRGGEHPAQEKEVLV